jgi:2-oxoglutarate ferredoxin oxidoreductase subunit alpha
MLIPATVHECFRFAQEAFNLAERFQTTVFCMSDLDLGMNNWASEAFPYPDDIPMDRGKVLKREDLERLGGFARYRDVDGDAIPYRTLPGTDHPAAGYFTRGTGHNERAEYTERPDDFVHLLDRLARKIDNSRSSVPTPEIDNSAGTAIGIIAYGTTHHAMAECRDQLANEHGIETDYMRLRALPFSPEVETFLRTHERIYVVEQNRDGQMRSLLTLDFPKQATRFR